MSQDQRFSNQSYERQIIIEERLISSGRLMQDYYNKIWLTIIAWMLTINSGGIVAVLSYWGTKESPININIIHNTFESFTLGLLSALLCLVVNLILAMIVILKYRKYTKDILADEYNLGKAFDLPCYGMLFDYLAWFFGVCSFISIINGIYYGYKTINIF